MLSGEKEDGRGGDWGGEGEKGGRGGGQEGGGEDRRGGRTGGEGGGEGYLRALFDHRNRPFISNHHCTTDLDRSQERVVTGHQDRIRDMGKHRDAMTGSCP